MIFESFVINLDEDVDRMIAVSKELAAQNIQFTRLPAINMKFIGLDTVKQ